MSVYVDEMRSRRTVRGGRPGCWSHLPADTHDELMPFARRLGLRPGWLHYAGTHRKHFDVVDTVRVTLPSRSDRAGASW